MHPVVIPCVKTGGGAIALRNTAVDEKSISRIHPHFALPLLHKSRSRRGVEKKVAFLLGSCGAEVRAGHEMTGFCAVERLLQDECSRCRPKPDALGADVHDITKILFSGPFILSCCCVISGF